MHIIYVGSRQQIALLKGKATAAHEVLCSDCGQLRLSFVESDKCGNCGSTNIIKGKIGQLERSQANGERESQETRDGQGQAQA